jgi:uncharacterized membrane protein YebE (DUF533 family)
MFDLNKILTALQTDPNLQRNALAGGGGFAAGLAASLLMGKSGRKWLGKAASYGAVAAVGGLAYHAWQKSQQAKAVGASPASAPAAPPVLEAEYQTAPPNTAFLPPPTDRIAQEQLGKALMRAMIAAAKADGKIDAAEQAAIFARLNALDLDADAKAFAFDALSAPLDIDAIVADATCPERAAEIYAASLVAIDADTPAERAYLQMLAARLALPPGLVAEIHAAAGATAPG